MFHHYGYKPAYTNVMVKLRFCWALFWDPLNIALSSREKPKKKKNHNKRLDNGNDNDTIKLMLIITVNTYHIQNSRNKMQWHKLNQKCFKDIPHNSLQHTFQPQHARPHKWRHVTQSSSWMGRLPSWEEEVIPDSWQAHWFPLLAPWEERLLALTTGWWRQAVLLETRAAEAVTLSAWQPTSSSAQHSAAPAGAGLTCSAAV